MQLEEQFTRDIIYVLPSIGTIRGWICKLMLCRMQVHFACKIGHDIMTLARQYLGPRLGWRMGVDELARQAVYRIHWIGGESKFP
jgi:hypothetical protein